MLASEVYAAGRASVARLAQGLDEAQLQRRVPGTPEWTVRELVSHLAGVCADLAAGRIDGAGTPPWTAKQVADRQGRTVDELLAEWAEHAPGVEASIDQFGTAGWRLAYDVTMHEADLREALDLPPADTPAHATVLDGLVALAERRIAKAGLPPLRLHAGDRSWGPDDAAASVRAPDEAELARALGGRRSYDRLRALDWQGDPEPYLPLLPLFPPA